jgi:bifunctional DNA-binding transcriptional regulator/antitoxin component of YhaV-PrlF toxin-antitoxin module
MTDPSYSLKVSEEGIIVFPDELIERMNWKENDELFFRDLGNGTFHVSTIPYNVKDLPKKDLPSAVITPAEDNQDEA